MTPGGGRVPGTPGEPGDGSAPAPRLGRGGPRLCSGVVFVCLFRVFWGGILGTPGWPEFLIFLPPLSKGWDYQSATPRHARFLVFLKQGLVHSVVQPDFELTAVLCLSLSNPGVTGERHYYWLRKKFTCRSEPGSALHLFPDLSGAGCCNGKTQRY